MSSLGIVLLILCLPISLSAKEIKVVVASETAVKVEAVKQVFKDYFSEDEVMVIACSTKSLIPNQPLGFNVAQRGIRNRIDSIPVEQSQAADCIVAIESYIEEENNMWYDKGLISLNGEIEVLTKSTPIPSYFVDLSKRMSGHSEVNEEGFSITVGEAIQKSFQDRDINKHDWHKEVEFGGVSRQSLIEEALFKAVHAQELSWLKEHIICYPDFPKKGIFFEDFFPLLSDPEAFRLTIDLLYERYKHKNIDVIVGLESRGFILAAALAYKLEVGFVPVRKPGKLPGQVLTVSYEKEYGTDQLSLSETAIKTNQRVLIIDDLIATGGSAKAAIDLVTLAKGRVIEFASLLEIKQLEGRQRLGISSFNLID